MRRIDAHHHVWDLAVRPQTWMVGPALAPIARTFTIEELAPLAAAAGVVGTVVVQTVPTPAETPELLALATAHPLIGAVVGWVDLTGVEVAGPDVADRIAALRAGTGGRFLRGVRHLVHDEPDPRWLCRPDVRRGLAAVGESGLAYDLLIRPEHLGPALETVRALPDQLFVVDHAAKPPVAAGVHDRRVDAPWVQGIRALARQPNVTCKLSGLLVEADWNSWTPEHLQPYAEVVLDAFGAERVMIGSDWPVCTLAGDYSASLTAYDAAVAALTDDERADVLWRTAARVYALDV